MVRGGSEPYGDLLAGIERYGIVAVGGVLMPANWHAESLEDIGAERKGDRGGEAHQGLAAQVVATILAQCLAAAIRGHHTLQIQAVGQKEAQNDQKPGGFPIHDSLSHLLPLLDGRCGPFIGEG